MIIMGGGAKRTIDKYPSNFVLQYIQLSTVTSRNPLYNQLTGNIAEYLEKGQAERML